ncbi:MAG: FG-GAP-like repeat-containing protein [Candidatus Eiseniibacteriota bacterium]
MPPHRPACLSVFAIVELLLVGAVAGNAAEPTPAPSKKEVILERFLGDERGRATRAAARVQRASGASAAPTASAIGSFSPLRSFRPFPGDAARLPDDAARGNPNGAGPLSPQGGPEPHNRATVATAGDLNADGFSDFVHGEGAYQEGAKTFLGRVTARLGTPAGWGTTVSVEGEEANSFFGHALSPAGDVDGDGRQDVLVGAPGERLSGGTTGTAYLFYGINGGITLASVWRYVSPQNDRAGYSVANAGDVNGDGFDDIVVGAPFHLDEGLELGAAHVFYGGPAGPPAAPSASLMPAIEFSGFGYSVSGAGDVNGDGYADIVVGAPFYSNGEVFEGALFLYLGSAAGISTSPAYTYESNGTTWEAGWSVCGIGDMDGDGYSDVALGAPFYGNGESSEGAVLVFPGRAVPATITPTPPWEFDTIGMQFGYSVGSGGDLNGDGLADLVIGGPGYQVGPDRLGALVILFGSPQFTPVEAWTGFTGEQANSGFGISVATGGDWQGDGYSELLMSLGTFFTGTETISTFTYLTGSPFHRTALGDERLVAMGGFDLTMLGVSVSVAGDVNGDGFDDLVAGAPDYSNVQDSEGRALLFLGAAKPFHPFGPFFTPLPDWTYESNRDDAFLGVKVAGAGDVNGDGYADVITGARGWSNGQEEEGAALVFHGSPSGLSPVPDWIVEGNQEFGRIGFNVCSAGDVNRDGFDDVLVAAPFFDAPTGDEGAALLYYGSALGLAHTPARVIAGAAAGELAGFGVAGVGDVNRDGFDDVLIGTPFYTNTVSLEGKIDLYLGSVAGLQVNPVVTLYGEHLNGVLGYPVSGAGDVNGDGFADFMATASGFSDPDLDEGAVFVWQGNASGIPSEPPWTMQGNEAGAAMGLTGLSSAGDYDRDGFSDVVIGTPGASADAGQVSVFFGSAGGLDNSAELVINADGDRSGRLGASVAGGGDLNGDGFPDIAYGAPEGDLIKGIDNGGVWVQLSNTIYESSDRRIRQRRADNLAPIPPGLRSNSTTAFRLSAQGRSAGGRDRVRLEWELKPFSTLLSGSGLARGPFAHTGPPVVSAGTFAPLSSLVSGLTPALGQHWRARLLSRSPLFPRTPWFSVAANGDQQLDFNTAGQAGAVDVPGADPVLPLALEFSGARPNPSRNGTSLVYALPRSGFVRLALHDAGGRRVRQLIDGNASAGPGSAVWDGRDDAGRRVAPGLYFARLAFEGHEVVSKLVLLP